MTFTEHDLFFPFFFLRILSMMYDSKKSGQRFHETALLFLFSPFQTPPAQYMIFPSNDSEGVQAIGLTLIYWSPHATPYQPYTFDFFLR